MAKIETSDLTLAQDGKDIYSWDGGLASDGKAYKHREFRKGVVEELTSVKTKIEGIEKDIEKSSKIKSISLNGEGVEPDQAGHVALVIDQMQVDENLDVGSTNPVQNAAVARKIKEIEESSKVEGTTEIVTGETKLAQAGAVADAITGMVTGIDVQDSEDGTQYVMTFKTRKADGTDEDGEVKFSKYTDDDKVVVNINLTDSAGSPMPSAQFMSLGSSFVVKYNVAVGTAGGSAVDGYSNLQARVIVKRGNTVLSAFQNAEFVNMVAGQDYTFDASQYLTDASAYTVQVEARADYEGQTLARTASARVTMVAVTLSTTFNVSNGLAGGGYSNDVTVPFSVVGTTGEKNLCYRLNGGDMFTTPLSTGSGAQSRNVVIGLGDMVEGRNVLEVYAKHEPSGVISEVFYMTLLKAGDEVKDYAGLMFKHKADGFQTTWNAPVLNAEQFTAWSMDYAGYDVASSQAEVKVMQGENAVKEDRLGRTEKGSYGKTNVTTEGLAYRVVCGGSEIGVSVSTKGHADIEATLASDAVCSFDAYGRSNSEKNAGTWKSGELEMAFEDVLWQVNENGAGSGWHNNRLLLSNGASMRLTKEGGHYYPFNEDDKPVGQAIADVGMTLEIEFSTANVTDTSAELITCLGQLANGNRYGLVVTPEEVKFLTGVVTTATDAGETITYEDSVGTKFEPGTNIKVAYTFYPNKSDNEQRTLIGFYVDGVESSASRWTGKVNFDIMSELLFSSAGADLLVKNVRIYNKALTDDESLNNYIVDRNHLEDTADEKGVRTLDEENRVLDESGKVSLQKLQALMPKRKNSCLIFIGTGSVESEVPSASDTMNVLDALAQLNDKKANKLVKKIMFYNGENPELSFIAENVFVRIQGTSSVNYSRKNWRIYFQKTASGYVATLSYGEIDSNGEQKNPVRTEGKKNVFRLRPDSVGVKLACPKCDFSDSSMTTNTGGAKFFTDGMKEMGLLTPAQRYAQDHGLADDYRASIDGIPCDIFAAKSEDEDLTYYGQYNMNNDKSDSYPIFGQDKAIGDETWGEGDTLNHLNANEEGVKEYLPIAIETLNNSNPCCLFQWVPATDANHEAFMDKNFDGGLEINHPKDTFWNGGKGDDAEEPNMKEHVGTGDKYDKMYKSIDRLMSFMYRCVAETEAGENMSYNVETGLYEGVDYTDDGEKFPYGKWKSAYFRAHAAEFLNVHYSLAYHMFADFNLGVDQFAKNILWRTWDGVIWYPTWYDGDCQLGNDNKSMLTGKYDDNRQTKRDGAYVMQGHDSWLWNLLIANFADARETLMTEGVDGGASFRSAFSVQKALNYFNKEQMDRWCARLYNKSGIFKYVYPFLNALPVGSGGTMQTYPQIYGMKGNLKAHRGYFINRRYDLKQVEYGYISTNGAQLYQSTSSQNDGHVLSAMSFALTIPYRVQISTSNGVQADSGVVDAKELHTLALAGAFNENDPLKVIGAEKIKEMAWHDDAFALGFNFGLFTSLVKLDMSVEQASGYRNASFLTGTQSMTLLEELVMTNNMIARNGDNGNVASLDLSWQSRLRKALLGGTGLEKLTLATGCPVTELVLPATLSELFLDYLPKLTDEGLTLQGIGNIKGFRCESTPGVDGLALLRRLHEAKKSGKGMLERFSITVDMADDGTLLEELSVYGTYTSSGANDNSHSGLRGRVKLTSYPDDEVLEKYARVYPELEIVLPEYTMIEIDEAITDEGYDSTGAISNFDNHTGPRYGNKYVVSGHMKKLIVDIHRYLGKLVDKGDSVPLPNLFPWDSSPFNNRKTYINGKMKVIQLDDDNSEYFAVRDAEGQKVAAPLDGMQGHGEVGVKIPVFYYKGINYVDAIDTDVSRRYMCVSYGQKPSEKVADDVTVLEIGKILAGEYDNATVYRTKYHLKVTNMADKVADRLKSDNYKYVLKIDVEGVKRMMLPANTDSSVCSVFTDEGGNVMVGEDGTVLNYGELAGRSTGAVVNNLPVMVSVPDGAKLLYFTLDYNIYNDWTGVGIEYMNIVMHRGSKYASAKDMNIDNADEWIADFEPRWEMNKAFFLHAACMVSDDYKELYTPFDGTKNFTTASEAGTADLSEEGTYCPYDMFRSAYKRGLQCVDMEALWKIEMLLMMKYGRRTEYILGTGNDSSDRRQNGVTRKYGMQDSEYLPDGTTFTDYNNAYYREKKGVAVTDPVEAEGVTFERLKVNCFLGIERISEMLMMILDRCASVTPLKSDGSNGVGYLAYIDASLNLKKVKSGNSMQAKNIAWGRACSMMPIKGGGGVITGYNIKYYFKVNYQKEFLYSNHFCVALNRLYGSGISFMGFEGARINAVNRAFHSRLMFRGDIEEIDDISEYLKTEEVRYPAPISDDGIDIFA